MSYYTDLSYKQFVVVAETEWKFDYGDYETSVRKIAASACLCDLQTHKCQSCNRKLQFSLNPRITVQSVKLGLVEWNIAFDDQTKKLEFSLQSVDDGADKELHVELVVHRRSDSNQSYEKKKTIRSSFSRSSTWMSWNLQYFCDHVFTLRILKSRSMFPDFTLENTTIGQLASDVKLRVVDQLFHVNKQFLSMHSEVFSRMLHGKFKEANQEEIELKHEHADPAVFHDFLLLMCDNDALPNPNNVAALCALANMYEVNAVRVKCQRHLWICREIPIEQRYMLAGELGLKELQKSINSNANSEERERIIDAVSKKAFALSLK